MYRLFLLLLLISGALSAQTPPWLTGQSRGEDLTIQLVTFGPGDDIPSYWGHTALIVQDSRLAESRIYNYGLYSFDKGMLLRFIKGRLIFSGGAFQVGGYLTWYERLNREIRIATLNLSPAQKKELAKNLAVSVLPQNKNYLYHHYFDNCSTRLRDLIDQALDGQFAKATAAPARMTLRQHTRRYICRNPWLEMVLMYLMNDEIDQPVKEWDEMFLPDELERDVLKTTYVDSSGQRHKLVSDYFTLYKAQRKPTPAWPPRHWPGALAVGSLLGFFGLFLAYRWKQRPSYRIHLTYGLYNFVLGLLLGVPGLVLTLMASFTEHTVTYHNENLLLANALTILIVPAAVGFVFDKSWAYRWLKYLWYFQALGGILAVSVKIFPAFDQDNLLVMAFILPISFGMALAEYWWHKKPAGS